jgi:hypothetical protein
MTRPSSRSSTFAPIAAKPVAISASRSLSLTRSSSRPLVVVRPLRHAGGHEKDREFVDHARRDIGGHVDAGQSRMPRGDIGYRFSTDHTLVRISQIRAHRLKHFVYAGAGRVHADMGDGHFAARV